MAIGVSYDDFWHGDPQIVNFAIESYQIAQKRDALLSDVSAWNTGRYVLLAVSTVLSQAFSKNSTAKYPNEPILATELDEKLAAQKRERELLQSHAGFLALVKARNARFQNGEVAK